MNNETVARYGRFISYVIWIVECISGIIFSSMFEGISGYGTLSIFILMTVGIIIFTIIVRQNKKNDSVFFVAFFILSIILAFYLSVKVNSTYLMILIYIMQWLVIVFFFERQLCVYLAGLQITTMLIILIMCIESPEEFAMISLRQFIIASICIVISAWIAASLISILIEQRKKNDDQKQSLDDLLRVVETVSDETNLKDINKSRFIAEISHLIRNAIKPIKSMNEMIASTTDINKIREYSEKIADSERNLSVMVEEIITYTQLEQDEIAVVEKRYNLGKIVEKLINDVYAEIDAKNIYLKVNVSADMPLYMEGDYVHLDKALRVIINNAIKFTDRGGVSVDIYRGRGLYGDNKFQLCIDVSDTGRGIRENERKNIFVPFYHVEEYNSKASGGTGLGLFIAAKLIKLMGGELSVASEYGRGSTFHIELPQRKDMEGNRLAELNGTKKEKLYPYLESKMPELSAIKVTKPDEMKAAVSEDKVNEDKAQEGLPVIPGIDWDVAFGFLPSKAIVIKTLGELHKSGYENANILRAFYEDTLAGKEGSLEQFKIKVHAIKSNLRMVGAVELSERAKELEYAARDGLLDVIKEKTEGFINSYIDLIGAVGVIPEIAAKSAVSKKKYSKEAVEELLDTVIKAMDDFDTELLDDSMNKLEEFEYASEELKLIKQLGTMVTNLDADGAKEIIAKIKEVM